MKVILQKSGQKITLGNNNYIASGGEGKVYAAGSNALKVYHDPRKMIPLKKIHELSKLSPKNVLVPRDVLLDSKRKPVGFSMILAPDSIFLTWLFNRGWKKQNGVDNNALLNIIKVMRETTETIHKEKCVIGDYNEMQFRVSKDYTNVFFIDTDSYQTPSFSCTAVMDTIRDRTLPFGTFNTGSDWFAFAIVTFQLWIGIHPYMPRHPQYSKRDAKGFVLMDNGISVYSKDATLPRQANPLSVIPPDLNDWYKEVFVNKVRSTPPVPGLPTLIATQEKKKVVANGRFEVKVLFEYSDKIKDVEYINGNPYIRTENTIYCGNIVHTRVFKNQEYLLSRMTGDYEIVIAKKKMDRIEFYKGPTMVQEIKIEHIMRSNGNIFLIKEGIIYIAGFSLLGEKVYYCPKKMGEVYGKYNIRAFDGAILQDMEGIPWFALPAIGKMINNLPVKYLSSRRIIDAKYQIHFDFGVLMVISEKGGDYQRSIFILKDNVISLTKTTKCNVGDMCNFVLINNMIAYVEDDKLILNMPGIGEKEIGNPPFDESKSLYTDGSRLLVADDKRLLHVSMI